jgi:hypothetical protein
MMHYKNTAAQVKHDEFQSMDKMSRTNMKEAREKISRKNGA